MIRTDVPRARLPVYGGLFFTTLSTLMYEVLLTRIFSVTMWYHFAFVAVSVALFGMTVGALIVHLLPRFFDERRLPDHLAIAALLFSITMVLSFVVHLQIEFQPAWSFSGIGFSALTYVIISIPFVFSGIAVSLSLTRYASQVGRLYAVDLTGAALGATGLVWLLNVTEDAASAVLAVASLAAIGSLCYAAASAERRPALAGAASAATLVLIALAATNTVQARDENAFLRIVHVKGADEEKPLFETWNAFSRIQIGGDPDAVSEATTPGQGGALPPLRHLGMTIDATAGTLITSYNGDPDSVAHLQNDVVALAHHIRPKSKVLLIGTGGGGEVLLSVTLGHPSVTAVEINGAILDAVNNRYGDFTGHLDQRPGINFVNDEGRAYVERSDEKYDILQIPFTDTWAATGAGAFALTENGLYTIDAFRTFIDHLSDNGILTVTRWYLPPQPIEAYRLTALAAESLRREGIDDPRGHIVLVQSKPNLPGVSVANILVSKQPFSNADLARIDEVSEARGWTVVLAPGEPSTDPLFAQIVESKDPNSLDIGYPADISPPTDDRPFFFQMVPFHDLFDRSLYGGANDYLARPVLVLFSLSVAVLGLTALCIVVPLVLTTSRRALQSTLPLVVFFAAIGFGFLLLEIAQMQRLSLFLGHPTYALSVVLFSLLLFSGIGSFLTDWLVRGRGAGVSAPQLWPLVMLLLVITLFGLFTPAIIDQFRGEETPVRIATAVALLAPMGLLLGMPFPLGMKVAATRPDAPTAFFWGINGATSVCASVLAVSISLGWGISMAFWTGALAYLIAALALCYTVIRPVAASA